VLKLLHTYRIQDNVNVYFNGDNEVRFRKGIWNYEEATLDLNWFETPSLKEAVSEIIKDLIDGKSIDVGDYHAKFSLTSDDNSTIIDLLDTLSDQSYLNDGSNDEMDMFLKCLIGGTVPESMLDNGQNNYKHVLTITDSEQMEKYLSETAQEINVNLSFLSDEDWKTVEKADITSRLNAIQTMEKQSELDFIFEQYDCVLICVERPHIKMLRTINRILLPLGKPMIISLLDGPFLSVMTLKGNETACFECFENRVMARLQDMGAYRNFVKETGGTMAKRKKTYATPILQAAGSVALFEALLYTNVSKAKLAGRLINVYIPLLEVQIQDLLRVPFCPACGHIAKAMYDEMYTSSKQIVNKLIDSVEIIDSLSK
jgi:thiazole/oxazole-forming peptide maturase SagC family component